MPLTEDKQLYFANKKKFGIKTIGDYEYEGRKYTCDEEDHCLTLYDNGRAHFPYHTNWYWASFTSYIPKLNKVISLNMGDGIGIDYNSTTNEKFYEDFLNVDGKLKKLDQTVISYNESDFMQTYTFKTLDTPKTY